MCTTVHQGWGQDKIANISKWQITNTISWLNENIWISLEISLKFVPEVRIDNIPALVQIMACHPPGDKPLSEPMMVSLLAHICITHPQWVKHVVMLIWDNSFKPWSWAMCHFNTMMRYAVVNHLSIVYTRRDIAARCQGTMDVDNGLQRNQQGRLH